MRKLSWLVRFAALVGIAIFLSLGAGAPEKRSAQLNWAGVRLFDDGMPKQSPATFHQPVIFEPNHGQAEKGVRFLARTSSYDLSLFDNSVAFTLIKPSQEKLRKGKGNERQRHMQSVQQATVRMKMKGGNPQPRIKPDKKLQSVSNYFLAGPGSGKTQAAGVPNFERVHYEQVYSGIDLVFYGKPDAPGRIEYDFVVAPGADPQQIRLEFAGVSAMTVDEAGDLILKTSVGDLRHARPIAYQERAGRREPVDAKFAFVGNHVEFALGDYDRELPLVVDPAIVYFHIFSTAPWSKVAVDSAGSAYIVTSSGLGPEANPTSLLIAKFPPGGGQPTFMLTGSSQFTPTDIAIDSIGQIYVAGTSFQSNQGHVVKMTPSGSVIYQTVLGGSGDDRVWGLSVDATGAVYVAGSTTSPVFPTTAGAFQQARSPADAGSDAFVAKLDANGNVIYSTLLGGVNGDEIRGIAVTAGGNATVTGSTKSADFPTTAGAFQPSHAAAPLWDCFVSQLSPSGGSLVFSTLLGGTGDDNCVAIALGAGNEPFVTGKTLSRPSFAISPFPVTAGSFQTSSTGEAFVSKLNSTGTGLVYSTIYGALSSEAIAVDSSGRAFVAGAVGFGYGQSHLILTSDSFFGAAEYSNHLGVLDAMGSTMVFSTDLGGWGSSGILDLALDSSGHAYYLGDGFQPLSISHSLVVPTTALTGLFLAKIAIATPSPRLITPRLESLGSHPVGRTTAPRMLTLVNSGNAPLHISSVSVEATARGDGNLFGAFSIVSGCPATVIAGGSCELEITFTPQLASGHTGLLRIDSDAPGQPRRIALSGSGLALLPEVTLDSLRVDFPGELVGVTSQPQHVSLTNSGYASLNISSITVSGDFASTHDCPASLAEAASCTISITSTPTALGSRIGSLTVVTNAEGSPRNIQLFGGGVSGPVIAAAPAGLTFPSQIVGTSGLPLTVVLRNTGDQVLNFSNISVGTADFGVLNACLSALAVNASCPVGVFFRPTVAGTRSDTLTIASNATAGPFTIALSGVGGDFNIAPASGSSMAASVTAGQSASFSLSFAPSGGFSGNVTLSCASSVPLSSCAVSPAALVLSSSSTANATVTVSTAARAVAPGPQAMSWPRVPPFVLFMALLSFAALPFMKAKRSQGILAARVPAFALVALLLCVLVSTACGGGGGGSVPAAPTLSAQGTTPGTYQVAVTATASVPGGNLTRTINLSVTVR